MSSTRTQSQLCTVTLQFHRLFSVRFHSILEISLKLLLYDKYVGLNLAKHDLYYYNCFFEIMRMVCDLNFFQNV